MTDAQVEYQTLTAPQKANLLRDRITQLETEHYRLSIAVEAPMTGSPSPADHTRLSEITGALRKLHARLAEVDGG